MKVLDFLRTTLDDESCVGSIRMKCIYVALAVICVVCYPEDDHISKDIATMIASTAVKYDGIQTLLAANDEYTGGIKTSELLVAKELWFALSNILDAGDEIGKYEAISILDSGISIMTKLRSVHGCIAPDILTAIFATLFRIVQRDLVTKKEFQKKQVLSQCLKVFNKGDTWGANDEKWTLNALCVFKSCQLKQLLIKRSDYVKLSSTVCHMSERIPYKCYYSNVHLQSDRWCLLNHQKQEDCRKSRSGGSSCPTVDKRRYRRGRESFSTQGNRRHHGTFIDSK